MKNFSVKWLPRLAYLFLFIYAVKFHISSSEFWPMTVSKSWLQFPHYEKSLAQKFLFGMFLSVFHILPLNDLYHVWLVKIIFAFIGLLSFKYFIDYLIQRYKLGPWIHFSIFFLFLSPTLMTNFFRIRSDQFGLFFFILSLYFLSLQKRKKSILSFLFLLLTSAKSILFPVGGLFLFGREVFDYFDRQTLKRKIHLSLIALAVFIWLSALNLHALYYYLDSWRSPDSYLLDFYNYFHIEWPLLLLSLIVALVFVFKHKRFQSAAFSAFSFFFVLFLIPQALPFFIASVLLLIYMPLLLFFGSQAIAREQKKALLTALVVLQSLNLALQHQHKRFYYFSENEQQYEFIKTTSRFLQLHPMPYLDGMGTLPRQNFIPCFVSPEDEQANAFCTEELKNQHPEMIIITQRLTGLGQIVFDSVQLNYLQIRPNVWVHKNKLTDVKAEEINVMHGPVPMFIFNYE